MTSETVLDHYETTDEFEEVLSLAELQASSGWEVDFVADMRERFDSWEDRMFLSSAQRQKLEDIAGE